LQLITAAAKERGFVTVSFSAKDVWLHDFKEIYAEIFKKADLPRCLEICANKIIAELGYDKSAVLPGQTFADYLSSIGDFNAVTKKEIRNQLQTVFLKNPLIDNNFAIACSLLTGAILGHPVLEESNRALLYAWMEGSKDVKIASVRNLGLSPSKITKYNARHMLRSLAEVLRLASFPGITVAVDNMDILISPAAADAIRYTKLKREDVYENIRELIDEIDTLKNIMFFYAFDKKLLDDELSGIKSYPALWMRIQNEIVSNEVNKFSDIIDLDSIAAALYGKDVLADMSEKIAEALNSSAGNAGAAANRITPDMAEFILSKARYNAISLPRQTVLATLNNNIEVEEVGLYDRF
jgi:hypothetical protein